MNKIFLHCLLAAAPVVCFSQTPAKDITKKKNDLITLKATLMQQSTTLQADVNHEQVLIDSVSRKLAVDSAELAKIKTADPEKNKTYIKNNEKKLQHFREQISQWTKDLNTEKAQLKDALDLLKDLGDQIKKLQN
jgi:hypothetical protein